MEQRTFNGYPLALGSIIGFMCGNIAGSALMGVENPTKEQIDEAMALNGGGRAKLGPGQVSDESELMMCLLYALAESRGKLDIDCIMKHYTQWGGLERISNFPNVFR